LKFFVFDAFRVGIGYLPSPNRIDLVNQLGLLHVPLVSICHHLTNSVETLLQEADGLSFIAPCKREGFVYKSLTSGHSFKVVSNAWLLKYE
jgi:hypothetical protein